MLDLALVPALMADAENFRLGYGGGFYDRFLAKNPHIKTIVVVAKELFVQSLPHDEFDISVDEVLISVK
jgi:5-formyltetrahydrofolate cyclo-ligase